MGRDDSASYGLVMGFIYIFNIIVGTGALTMPKAFENTGIILSSVLLIFLTIMSFITATFMFEAMAIANAVKNYSKFEGTYIKQRDGFINPVYENNENASKLADTDTSLINEERPLIANNNSALLADSQYQSQNDSSMTEYSTNVDKIFDIANKFEMGEMAALFFNKIGQFFFYLAMILYLYGDLAIYDAAVPKSLRDTVW